ncbi:MsnO8 family LLM class oxidoreductase [Dasania sp. GY-MA-18]|uniref:MsnO8 family LLM class oxidoreductase n=1 Tax=Dasania phycosphaerae TaxID=2950436 RepID=A0A9J6RS65_9GAMM|nr:MULTISPECIES: MsnO8 family LLM class oxidoreductase [Dasania]MCR8924264.1 MsnO8 family LLM class oxidoreductase [Dasania sp. GY-MA-18]MCZ0866917.1 MsnO8 family LLM class oxidoreductase [Dasania phycosphaerae]MCZ0870421.1 MsnO8 family LLM class oxidoreductase [Dasania phycosphaerae]
MTLRISVTDQAPIHANSSSAESPLLSVKLAQACERWGYHRYWMAEHHNSGIFACPCPEILIAHIASQTQRIRVGTGGVMLSHYSPYKVAEQFRMLEALYPNRVDLGIGRAPGGDELASQALAFPAQAAHGQTYAQQAEYLQHFLQGSMPADHPYSQLKVTPEIDTSPSLWMLGSGSGSCQFAGELGMGFVLAQFIDSTTPANKIFNAYRAAHHAAGHKHPAQTMLALAVVCADNAEEALQIASIRAYSKVLAHMHGIRDGFPSPQQTMDAIKKMSHSEKGYFDKCLADIIAGTGEACRQRIEDLVASCQADEVSVVNVTHTFEQRLRSYELLAQSFEIF